MKDFLIFFVILVILDLVMINIRKQYYYDFYRLVQGSELKINYLYAVLSYIVIAFTLWYFIITKKATIPEAMILGACLYAVYDLTNQATLTNWTLDMTIKDIVWGSVLAGISTYIYVELKKDK